MNHNKYLITALTALLLLAVGLSACQPANGETETPVETPVVTLDLGEAMPTLEPVVLEGAEVTESGLQFLETEPGDGPTPQEGDILVMEVVATLADGTELINTRVEGSPAVAIMGREQLLPGWEEGMAMMKVGQRAKMVLPPELAFGEEGMGFIPPNAQLILDVELISAEQPPQPSTYSDADLTTTDSGLQYVDLVTGDGETVEEFSTATTHYVIWVQEESGDKFIVSSYYTQPIRFVVGRGDTVFPGWEEGVTGMKVGGKRLLIVPPELALGDQGAGDIPPNATLVMEIEVTDLTIPPKMTAVNAEDYTTTESGLKYYDIVEGEGDSPQEGQIVVVNYAGWLEDGTPFDNSYDRGEPFSFELGAGMVIPGWEEGLLGMKVGGKRQIVIPPDLAYGETGAGGVIPPNATLIFEVELLEIQDKPQE
ncbi:MAG: hypothetical protein D6803_00635 [Anaerolineae bacterium]|nr:MAG: hypothetical protein D6803_00635 [Anaerolineae bacterium]